MKLQHLHCSFMTINDCRSNLDDLYCVKPQRLSKLIANVIKEDKRNNVTDHRRISYSYIITNTDFKELFKLAGKTSLKTFLSNSY